MNVRPVFALLASLCAWLVGLWSPAAGVELSFPPAGPAFTADAFVPESIPASLTLPTYGTPPFPAVVIVHASGGLLRQGPEPDYVAALTSAGIAALVIDMWKARGMPAGPAAFGAGGGPDRRPQALQDTLPDVFGALKFLAGNSTIDARRIGILGFSWGAAQSLLTANETAAARALPNGERFAAHAAHYLVCWPFTPEGVGLRGLQSSWSGAPIQLQVAGRDDYDDADGGATCRAVVAGLPADQRAKLDLIIHKDATHLWDFKVPVSITFNDRRSHKGRGGAVHVVPDSMLTQRARTTTVDFFRAAFGP